MPQQKNLKIAILSISIFLMSHLAIAPAIPKLYELYHNNNEKLGLASVESLVTIPALMITIFVVLSNFIVATIGKKYTTLIGLSLIFVSGIVSFFSANFTIVFICRLLLGIGIGLYNSISISIISDYYYGYERDNMIGYRTAFLNIGKALTTFISGYAIIFGPNYAFLVYLLVIPVFFMFNNYVPNKKEEAKTFKNNFIFNKKNILTMLATFLVGISYIGVTIKIPTLLVTKHGLATTTSSNLLTILALSGILSGFLFGKFIKYFGDKTLLIMISFMIFGNFIFTITTNIIVLFIASTLIGASFVGTMSYIFYYISKNFRKEHINFSISMALTAGNIGVILTPLILTKLLERLSLELFVTPFYITSALSLCNIIIYYFLVKENKKI
ncbi:MFS transporter [Gemella sp. GH3]|uniref:MFS transporter n=1 Tax=unclassified Gemella TaxID=2624949 RepID=UPI0015D012E5|nr:MULTISPECIES: MFS transporter [unclassified Gemella]MBF0713679.1 MFS transporter [Gemella sp. GH3.1]NYS50631.1 MFS transporter [Gemella sp. GH3]